MERIKWDIHINVEDGNNCYFSILMAIARFYGSNYANLMLSRLSFGFFSNEKHVMNKIVRTMAADHFNKQDLLLGIEIEEIKIDNNINGIHEHLKDSPVMIYVDAYDCEWSPYYHKEHYAHFCLVNSVDEKNRGFECVDVYYPQKGTISIEYCKMINLCKRLYRFNKLPNKGYKIETALVSLKKFTNAISVDEMNRQKDYVTNIIKNDFDIDCICDIEHLQTSEFLLHLLFAADDKSLSIRGLKQLGCIIKKDIFSDLCTEIEKCQNELEKLRRLFIKCIIKRSTDIEAILNSIELIYSFEIKGLVLFIAALKEV